MTELLAEHGTWLMPLLIFIARVVDVSIGTMRIIFLSRGMKILAPACGFVEVFIWLLAIGQIMQNLDSWVNYIAFAGGFTAGNYIGMLIEERLAMGLLALWVITRKDATELLDELRDRQWGITRVAARGVKGKVRILIMVIRRKAVKEALTIIRRHDPEAFVTIKDVREVSGGYFSLPEQGLSLRQWQFLRMRKGK